MQGSGYTALSAAPATTAPGRFDMHHGHVWIDSASPVVETADYATYPIKQGDMVIDSANSDLYLCISVATSAKSASFVGIKL
jgi:hypothetical protein